MSGEKMAREYYGENYDLAMENYKLGEKAEKAAFLKKYQKANVSKFEFDVSVSKSGEITGRNIFYKFDKFGDSYNITSDAFKKSLKGIKSLGLTPEQIQQFSYYGEKNYTKFNKIFSEETQKLRNNFSDKHPHANLNNMLESQVLPFELTRFKIYVDNNASFTSNFEKLDTAWENKNKSKNITKEKFDYKTDPYFASLLAAYIISYESGISLKHLEYNPTTPKIITSIARYFVYYHMKRFLKYPNKLDFYVDENTISFVQENIPTRKIWKKKLDRTQERMSVWLAGKNKHTVRNYHFELGNNVAQGVYGISYQELDEVVNTGDQDWIKFLKSKSNGLTKTGQKLFQHAIESYVYCILGAQAQTHWPIVDAGAKSLQTQDIFHKLVLDTIAQDNPAVAILNMRRAIKDTNVVLNMVVSPGVILLPSSLIIQKKMVRGYNNELTLATNNMKFGKNVNINYTREADIFEPDPPVAERNIMLPKKNGVKKYIGFGDSSFSAEQKSQPQPENLEEKTPLITLFGFTIVIGLLIAKYLL